MNLNEIIGDLTKMSHKTHRMINRGRKTLNRSYLTNLDGNVMVPTASHNIYKEFSVNDSYERITGADTTC